MTPNLLILNLQSVLFANENQRAEKPRTEREAAVANGWTLDQAPEDASDGWFKISPYGVFPGAKRDRPQHFGQPEAGAIVSEFNSVLGKLGRLFRGVPIFRGHPDVDPTMWTDDRRLGKITAMEARPDGLWGRAEWNSLGAENQREGFWIYPSPRWDAPAGQKEFRPDRLLSIGLTNTPRIPASEPVTNSAPGEKSATDATETTDSTNTEPTTTDTMDPKLIREKLGLPVEATDEECYAKMDAMNEAANAAADTAAAKAAAEMKAEEAVTEAATAKGKAEDAEKEKEKMANSLQAERKRADGAIIDLATARAAITAAERKAWETRLGDPEQREAAFNELAGLKPRLNTQPLSGGQTRADREASGNLREQVANAVAKLEADGMTYTEAWTRVKKNPAFASYFG